MSKIANLQVDDPVVINSGYKFTNDEIKAVDDKIRGTQQHIVDSLISGYVSTWFTLDSGSAAVVTGDAVCAAAAAVPNTVTKATAGALANSLGIVGVVVLGGLGGTKIRVAVSGLLPATITGLGAVAGVARVSTSARAERVAQLSTGDYPIGPIDATGQVSLNTGLSPSLLNIAGGSGVTYTSHGAITAGQNVATYGAGGTYVQVATPAVLRAGAVLVGIALTSVGDAQTVSVAVLGAKVSSSLGAGAATRVGITGTGASVRLAKSVGGWEIGSCDAAGVISVDPVTPNGQSAFVGYNPVLWGLIPNDWSQCINNSVQWDAMMTDISVANTGIGHQIFINDTYYFYRYVPLNRRVKIEGLVASLNGPGRIVVPSGTRCMVAECTTSSADGGDGNRSVVSNVELMTGIPPGMLPRAVGGYTAGQFATIPNETRYYLLATTTGNTANTLPAALTVGNVAYAPLPRSTVVDGGVTWRYYAYAFDFVHVAKLNAHYDVGDMFRLYGDARYTGVVTTAGTSGGALPPALGVNGDLSFDGLSGQTWGSLVYRVDCYNAFAAKTEVKLDRVVASGIDPGGTLSNFTNFAFHFQTDLLVDSTAADNSIIDHCIAQSCGGGLYLAGSDSNAITIVGCSMASLGAKQDGEVGVGYWDHAQGSNVYIGCYTQNGSGPGFVDKPQFGNTYVECRTENYKPPIWASTSHIQNCTDGQMGGSTRSTDSTGTSQLLNSRDVTSAPNLAMKVDTGAQQAFTFARSGDLTSLGWKLNTAGSGNQDTWEFGQYPRPPLGASMTVGGPQSAMGPGVLWFHQGAFFGDSAKSILGFDAATKTSNIFAGGLRNGGDTFPRVDVPAPGDISCDVSWTTGYDAPAWTNGLVVQVERRHGVQGYRQRGTTTVGDNVGYVYRTTKPGTTGGGAPTWSNASANNANAPTAYALSTEYSPDEYMRPLSGSLDGQGRDTGNAHQYKPKRWPAWQANTDYQANSIVSSSGTDSECYFVPRIQAFVSGIWRVGQLMTPSHPADPAFGMVFQVVSATSGNNPANIGGSFVTLGDEPGYATLAGTPWPTDYTTSVTSGTGTMKRIHLKSGAAEPAWRTNWDQYISRTGVTFDGVDDKWFYWACIKLRSNVLQQPTLATGAASETPDSPLTVPSDYFPNDVASVHQPNGFGLTWVESGAENPNTRVADNGTEWTRFGFQTGYYQLGRYFVEGITNVGVGAATPVTRTQAFAELCRFTGAGGFVATLNGDALINGASYHFMNAATLAVTINPGGVVLANGAACHLKYDGTNLIRCT